MQVALFGSLDAAGTSRQIRGNLAERARNSGGTTMKTTDAAPLVLRVAAKATLMRRRTTRLRQHGRAQQPPTTPELTSSSPPVCHSPTRFGVRPVRRHGRCFEVAMGANPLTWDASGQYFPFGSPVRQRRSATLTAERRTRVGRIDFNAAAGRRDQRRAAAAPGRRHLQRSDRSHCRRLVPS